MNSKINIHDLKNQDYVAFNLVKASWLQKAIRRGENAKALAIANLYIKENQIEGLKRRLMVFATEDIGIATPNILILLKNKNVRETINILCQSYKNREVDRFLLNVRDNKDVKDLKEVKILKNLLNLSNVWFFNKRIKSNKEDLIEYVFSYDLNEFQKETCEIALENYFLLSKHKTLGARTNLAFIALIIGRNIKKERLKQDYDLTFSSMEIISSVDSYALDKHTPFGTKTYEEWVEFGAVVFPELKYDDAYLNNKELYPY